VAITRAHSIRANCSAKNASRPVPASIPYARRNSAMAGQRHPGCHACVWRGRGFLEGRMAGHRRQLFLAQDRVLRHHPIENGAEPVALIFGADRATEPARVKGAYDPVADLYPRRAVPDRRDFPGAIAQRRSLSELACTRIRTSLGPAADARSNAGRSRHRCRSGQ
jgi:hypothetical protein